MEIEHVFISEYEAEKTMEILVKMRIFAEKFREST